MVKLSGSGHSKIPVPSHVVSGEITIPAPVEYGPSSCAQSGAVSGAVSRARYSFCRPLKEYFCTISVGDLCLISMVRIVSRTVSVYVFLLPSSSISVTFSVCVSVWVS